VCVCVFFFFWKEKIRGKRKENKDNCFFLFNFVVCVEYKQFTGELYSNIIG